MKNFHNIEQWPFLEPFKKHWKEIRDEYLAIQNEAIEWPEKMLYNQGWDAVGLIFQKYPLFYNIVKCPITVGLINQVPDVYIAGFSVLKPGTIIYPHMGYTEDVWRCHLGLICPEGAWIKVGDERYDWKEGEMTVFDDTILHEAQNNSDQTRVILIIDFMKQKC